MMFVYFQLDGRRLRCPQAATKKQAAEKQRSIRSLTI
jgi:hypothetical protein